MKPLVFALLAIGLTTWPPSLRADFPTLRLELLAEGQFSSPTGVTHAGDQSGRLFVVDQRGKIHIFVDGAVLPTPFLDLSASLVSERPGFDERGLLGLAFHPDYGSSGMDGEGRFYVYYSAPSPNAPGTAQNPVDHRSVIAEFQVSAHADMADPASERILLTFDQPQFNHNGGEIAFGPDGFLYVATGDGGSSNDNNAGHTGGSSARPTNGLGNSQDLTNLLGKILRVDPQGNNGAGGEYGIPPDNPFVGQGGGVQEEIFAFGLRNPWRFSFDDGPGGTGRLFCADVGQGQVEEINLIVSGGNYGWRKKEGEFFPSFSIDAPAPTGTVVDPIAQYAHTAVTIGNPALRQIGNSVTGGFVYRGSAIPDLQGKYIFADWSNSFGNPNGTLLGLEELTPNNFTLSVLDVEDGNPIGRYIPSLGEDEQGELYVATKTALAPSATDPATGLPSGQLFRIAAVPVPIDISVAPSKDNSIYSENASLSNGQGDWLFAGEIARGDVRRALLAFDLSSIPAGSTITATNLDLTMDKTIAGASNQSLHRLTLDWGEGGSNASGQEGGGASAQSGDATWSMAMFNTVSWNSLGGDFEASPSGTTSVDGNGSYNWTSVQMVADVQNWLDGVAPNFGWILVGAEGSGTSAKRFASNQHPTGANRPKLNVSYTPSVPAVPRRQVWERQFYAAGTYLDPNDNSDGDSTALLLEYGWDLDPTAADDAADRFTATIDSTGNAANLEFVRDPRATDLNYTLEVSTDLINWTPLVVSSAGGAPSGSGFVSEAPDQSNSELRRVVVLDPIVPSVRALAFYRLTVTRP